MSTHGRFGLWTGLAVGVLMLGTLAMGVTYAQQRAERGGPMWQRGGGMMGMMGAYSPGIGSGPGTALSPTTRAKIIEQQIEFVRNTSKLRTDLTIRQLELQELLLAARPDSIAVDSKYAEIGRIQGELQQAAVLSNTAIARLVPDSERGRYNLGMMNNGMGGYRMGYGMMPGYGTGLGTPPGYCPYCAMMGSVPGNGGFSWW